MPAFAVDFSQRHFVGGRTHDGMFHVSDWLPTLSGFAGFRPRGRFDGVDQGPALAGTAPSPRTEVLHEMFTYNESTFSNEALFALRVGKYKLIHGIARFSAWDHQPGRFFLNTEPARVSNKVLEAILKCVEFIMGESRADNAKIYLIGFTFFGRGLVKDAKTNKYIPQTYLFDIDNDPEERKNLADDLPDVVARLHHRAAQLQAQRPPQPNYWLVHPEISKTFFPGKCTRSHLCTFTHPWLPEDDNASAVHPVYLIQTMDLARTLATSATIKAVKWALCSFLVLLLSFVVDRRALTRKGGARSLTGEVARFVVSIFARYLRV